MAEDMEKTSEESKQVGERKKFEDDILDGIHREVISREIAHREGRQEGRSVVTDLPEDGHDFIAYGQKEMVEEFDNRLKKDKVKYRGIDVGRYPIDDAEKVEKVRDMGNRQLSESTRMRKRVEEGLSLPGLPAPVENFLRRNIEGSPVESKEETESSGGQVIPKIRYKPNAGSKEEGESGGGESDG